MVRSMTNEEMVQHFVDRINELEEENKELIKDEILRQTTCKKAVDVFGKEHMMLAAIVEMSALTQELTKVMRGKADFDAVDNKMANVEVLMELLKYVFSNTWKVKDLRRKKILLLEERVAKGE